MTALVFCALQLLTWAACRQRTLPVYALSFLPSAILLVFLCDEHSLLGGPVALILALAASVLCRRVSSARVRRVTEAVLVPALYMACGPLVVVFVLVRILDEGGRGDSRAGAAGNKDLLRPGVHGGWKGRGLPPGHLHAVPLWADL